MSTACQDTAFRAILARAARREQQRASRVSDAGGVHAAQLVLQIADLIAEAGRDLELKLSGSRVHLLGELGDQPDELAAQRAGHRRLTAGLLSAAPPISCSVSASSRTVWSRMPVMRLRSDRGLELGRSHAHRPAQPPPRRRRPAHGRPGRACRYGSGISRSRHYPDTDQYGSIRSDGGRTASWRAEHRASDLTVTRAPGDSGLPRRTCRPDNLRKTMAFHRDDRPIPGRCGWAGAGVVGRCQARTVRSPVSGCACPCPAGKRGDRASYGCTSLGYSAVKLRERQALPVTLGGERLALAFHGGSAA